VKDNDLLITPSTTFQFKKEKAMNYDIVDCYINLLDEQEGNDATIIHRNYQSIEVFSSTTTTPSSNTIATPSIFDRLNTDEWICILLYCNKMDLIQLSQTCKTLYILTSMDIVWKKLLQTPTEKTKYMD
jgi:hypothetical protein